MLIEDILSHVSYMLLKSHLGIIIEDFLHFPLTQPEWLPFMSFNIATHFYSLTQYAFLYAFLYPFLCAILFFEDLSNYPILSHCHTVTRIYAWRFSFAKKYHFISLWNCHTYHFRICFTWRLILLNFHFISTCTPSYMVDASLISSFVQLLVNHLLICV
jgi:hypothetical protein